MTDTIRLAAEPGSDAPARPIWFAPASAVLAATAVWLLAVPLAGAELFVAQGDAVVEVSPVSVVLGSAVGGLGALAIGWAARRWSARPRRRFVVVTGLLAVLSVLSPATAATTVSTGLWLGSMHLVVAVAAIPFVLERLPHAVSDVVDAQE